MKKKLLLSAGLLATPVLACASDMGGLMFIFTAILPGVAVAVLTLLLLGLTLGTAGSAEKGLSRSACFFLVYAIYAVSGLGILTTLLMMPRELNGPYRNSALLMFVPAGSMLYGAVCAWFARRALLDPSEKNTGLLRVLTAFYFTLGLLLLLGGYLFENLPY